MTGSRAVSVVINTVNRAKLLNATLQSLRQLDYDNFEIVVVDGPSTDDTSDVLKAWGADIKRAHCPEMNLSKSRNIGIAASSGDFVAFIDDDSVPEPEWLSQALSAFDADEVAGAGGKVFDRTGYALQYRYANADRLGNAKWKLTEPSPQYCFPMAFEFPYLQGTNAVFRRRALVEIGGFDEEYEYYLDETDVCLRLIDAGYVILQLAGAFVHHKAAPSAIRDERITRQLYSVLKNKIYFARRHGAGHRSPADIDRDSLAFVQQQRDYVHHFVFEGRLTHADRMAFERDALRAWSDGVEAAAKPARLLSGETMLRHRSEFRGFAVTRPSPHRLTIALLCEDYPPDLLGGIARFTEAKAHALAAHGHIVHVIARGRDTNSVQLEGNVWVHRIRAEPHDRDELARDMNIPQAIWDQSRSFLDELDRISTHHSIDVVEAPVWSAPGAAAIMAGRYIVVTSLQTTLKLSLSSRPDLIGNREMLDTYVHPLIALEQFVISRADHIWAISQSIADEVEQAYGLSLDAASLSVFHLGMPDWSQPASNPNDRGARKGLRLLFVGRLEKRKGIDVLLRIAPRLCSEYPDLNIDIVGDDTIVVEDGKSYREFFQQAHAATAASRITFHGKLSDTELREMYAACDVFVAPSRFESFGLIYLEAMMFGKPVVACQGGGTSEVVIDGTTGLLAEPGDDESLYKRVKTLLDDPDKRIEMGREGRRRYEQFFSAESMGTQSIQMYLRCLQRKRAAILR